MQALCSDLREVGRTLWLRPHLPVLPVSVPKGSGVKEPRVGPGGFPRVSSWHPTFYRVCPACMAFMAAYMAACMAACLAASSGQDSSAQFRTVQFR